MQNNNKTVEGWCGAAGVTSGRRRAEGSGGGEEEAGSAAH